MPGRAVKEDARITRLRAVSAFGVALTLLLMVKDALRGWLTHYAAPWIGDLAAAKANEPKYDAVRTIAKWFSDTQSGISWWPIGLSVLGGLAAAAVVVAHSAWWHLRTRQGQHAVLRQLPSDLLNFLDGTARRGVLRRHGPVFEFRHRRVQRFLADSEEAGRPTGDLIAEARALADGNDFRGRSSSSRSWFRTTSGRSRHWPRSTRRGRAASAGTPSTGRPEEAPPSCATVVGDVPRCRTSAGGPGAGSLPRAAPGLLPRIAPRRAAVLPHTQRRGKSVETARGTTPPPGRDQIVALMERRSKAPLPTRFHKHYANHITAVLDGLHDAGPPPVNELGWWTSTPLGDVTATALQHAASHHPGVLQAGTVFAALMDADRRAGDWARFALHTSSPSAD